MSGLSGKQGQRCLAPVLMLALAVVLGVLPVGVGAEPREAGPEYANLQWNLRQIGVADAWGLSQGDPSTVIGVVDTGVDAQHPEFAGRIVPGRNTATNSDNTTDRDGHGTFVAGVAVARGEAMQGVAPQARVMPLRVAGTENDIANGSQALAVPMVNALRYARERGVRIFNYSVATRTSAAEFRQAIAEAIAGGALIFAASGNTGKATTTETQRFPSAYPNVLGVAALDRTGGLSSYSTRGPHVQLAAPGGDMTVDKPTEADRKRYLVIGPALTSDKDPYTWGRGTSFAAPHAAGVAALVWAANPALSADQVREILTTTADRTGTDRNDETGWGRVNAFRAVLAAQAEPFVVAINTPRWGETVTDSVLVRGWAADIRADVDVRRPLTSVQVWLGDDPSTGQLLGDAELNVGSAALADALRNPTLRRAGWTFTWQPPPDLTGDVRLTVVATNGADTARRSVGVTLRPPG